MARSRHGSRQSATLLAHLLDTAPQWSHGYALMGESGLGSGTLYPLLMRLADDGLLEARHEPSPLPGRPPRRAYRLSARGVAFARERAAKLQVTGPVPVPEGGR